MRPKRTPWNDDQKRRLIELAKQYEVLWRRFPNNNNTRIVALRRSALQQVQMHFASEGFTVDDIREQWRNLKDVFYKRYEMVMRRTMQGETVPKMNWRFWNELKFLASDKAMANNRRGLQYGNYEFFEQVMQHHQQQSETGSFDGQGGGQHNARHHQLQFDDSLIDVDGSLGSGGGHYQNESGEWEAAPTNDDDDDNNDGNATTVTDQQQQHGTLGMAEMLQIKMENGPKLRQRQQRGMMRESAASSRMSMVPTATVQQLGDQIDSSMSRLRQINQRQQLRSFQPSPQQQPARKGAKKFSLMESPMANKQQTKQQQQQGQQPEQKDRFKYFGAFVETAVRDLHQQSPDVARRLVQSIYSTVSNHQIEATTMGMVEEAGNEMNRHGANNAMPSTTT